MPLTDDVVDRARALDRRAAEDLLADVYPAVHRITVALTGDARLSRDVIIPALLDRAVRVLPTWRRGVSPENWFYHHAVLAARGAAPPAGGGDDPLLAATATPAHAAFVRAVRGLPRQQAEAYVLHHGERLNERLLGVAMDCSAAAAANHLRAATAVLRAMAGGDAAEAAHAAALARAYAALATDPRDVRPAVRPAVRRAVLRRRVRRLVRLGVLLLVAIVLAVAAYAAWRAGIFRLPHA